MNMGSFDSLEYIDHRGRVKSVDTAGRRVEVELQEQAECGSCPAAKLCVGDKGHRDTVWVETSGAAGYKPGDEVVVRGTEQLHRKAIMIATVIPSVALVAVMVIIYMLTADQTVAALGGIVSMIFFFVMLYLFRNRIAHEFSFTIKPCKPDRL